MKQPNACTDATLRAAICSADAPARASALEYFVKGVYAYIFNTLSGYATNQKWKCTAEAVWDACTDAYVAFKRNTEKPGFSFQKEDTCAYYFKIARNILSQRLPFDDTHVEEYNSTRHEIATPDTPQSEMERSEMHQRIRAALQKLNPEEREILTCQAEGYKVSQIATYMQVEYPRIHLEMEALGLKAAEKHLWTESYTKVRLRRAKQKLRDILGDLD